MSFSSNDSSPLSSISSSPKSSFSESSDEYNEERRDSFERVYTKDFLLSLRKCPSALIKPDDLPDLPQIICNEPNLNRKRTESCPSAGYNDNYTQNFYRNPHQYRGRRRYRGTSESQAFEERRKGTTREPNDTSRKSLG